MQHESIASLRRGSLTREVTNRKYVPAEALLSVSGLSDRSERVAEVTLSVIFEERQGPVSSKDTQSQVRRTRTVTCF